MTVMEVNGSDTTTLRLFALDLPAEAVERFTKQAGTGEWPLKYALGAQSLAPGFVDIIDLRDLGEMPLSRYMVDAYAVAGADFDAMRTRIDSLTGHVVVLPARAFDRVSQKLTISTPLRWIGTFAEPPRATKGAPLRAKSAQGQSGGHSHEGAAGLPWAVKLALFALGAIVLLGAAVLIF